MLYEDLAAWIQMNVSLVMDHHRKNGYKRPEAEPGGASRGRDPLVQ
jgi:hypothetical protein